MAQFLKKLAFIALILCSANAIKAQTTTLSADDTVAYVNATLHKYPSLEFVASGCPGFEQVITISEDRRSLLIRQISFKSTEVEKCGEVQTLTFPIFSLNFSGLGTWTRQGQHSSFLLDCMDRVDCFSRSSASLRTTAVTNQWFLWMTAPDQVSDGLEEAIRHLVASLLTEANGRIDGGDPFAKRAK